MRATRLLSAANGDMPAGGSLPIPQDLFLVTETNLATILEHVDEVKPRLLVVDSVQTTYLSELDSSAGSVTQVRETASRLRELAKSSGMAVFLIGHVTKEGAIAGPRVLEHIVDTVLYLEGDRFQSYRLLRSVKNRFGATSEVGVFEMRERGMVEVRNPSEAFLAERLVNAPGSSYRCDHGGHPATAGRDPGSDQPDRFRQPAPHAQRRGLQPPVAHRGGAHPPCGFTAGRAGYIRQRGGGPLHRRARRRPGGSGCHRLLDARRAGTR